MTIALTLGLVLGCGGDQSKSKSGGKSGKSATYKQLLKQAIAAEEAGKPKVADEKYARAVKLKPSHFVTVRRYTLFLIDQKRPKDAVAVAAKFVDGALDELKGYKLLAEAKIAAGDLLGAYDTLTELIALDDGDPGAYDLRGRVQVMRGQFDPGIADLRVAVDRDPENPEFHVSLGSALHRAEKLDEAAIELRKALQLDPSHARAHVLLGVVLRDQQDYDEALSHHKAAVEADDKYARAYYELGITQNFLGENENAEKNLARAVKLDPKDAMNWYVYGEILRNRQKYAEAAPAYRKALEIDPEHPKAANKLGLVLFYAEDYAEAEVVLTAQVRRSPKDPYPFFNLGMVYGKQGKYQLGIEAFERFIELAPKGDGDIPVARDKIRDLKYKARKSR